MVWVYTTVSHACQIISKLWHAHIAAEERIFRCLKLGCWQNIGGCEFPGHWFSETVGAFTASFAAQAPGFCMFLASAHGGGQFLVLVGSSSLMEGWRDQLIQHTSGLSVFKPLADS